jgi:hypothetical protein
MKSCQSVSCLVKPCDADDWLIPWQGFERQTDASWSRPERRAAKLIAAPPFISLPIQRAQGRGPAAPTIKIDQRLSAGTGRPKPSRIACRASSRRRKGAERRINHVDRCAPARRNAHSEMRPLTGLQMGIWAFSGLRLRLSRSMPPSWAGGTQPRFRVWSIR